MLKQFKSIFNNHSIELSKVEKDKLIELEKDAYYNESKRLIIERGIEKAREKYE
jgi:hypothetical protein